MSVFIGDEGCIFMILRRQGRVYFSLYAPYFRWALIYR